MNRWVLPPLSLVVKENNFKKPLNKTFLSHPITWVYMKRQPVNTG